MNPRIEKKISKRLAELCPTLFRDAWILDCPSELADDRNSSISHCYHVGGGTDYWGDGCDAYSVWFHWLMVWEWHGDFPHYPQGHELEHFPNTEGFNPTTINLIALAKKCEKLAFDEEIKRKAEWNNNFKTGDL